VRSLRRSGWLRVMDGDTTVEEVLRVTADAEVLGETSETPHAPVQV